jgi:ParB-like chromosome segregation protein Spo0J
MASRKAATPKASRSQPQSTAPTEPHPFALLFPLVTGETFDGVVASIKERGFLIAFPIHTYQDKVLDGWTRFRAAKEAGVEPVYVPFDGDDAAALAFVCAANGPRRHLTQEQKREVVGNILKQDPKLADRQIARMVGASPTTVGTVRSELEATDQIGQLKKRVGKDGKERKAKQPRKPKVEPAPQPEPAPQQPEGEPEPFDVEAAAAAADRAFADAVADEPSDDDEPEKPTVPLVLCNHTRSLRACPCCQAREAARKLGRWTRCLAEGPEDWESVLWGFRTHPLFRPTLEEIDQAMEVLRKLKVALKAIPNAPAETDNTEQQTVH